MPGCRAPPALQRCPHSPLPAGPARLRFTFCPTPGLTRNRNRVVGPDGYRRRHLQQSQPYSAPSSSPPSNLLPDASSVSSGSSNGSGADSGGREAAGSDAVGDDASGAAHGASDGAGVEVSLSPASANRLPFVLVLAICTLHVTEDELEWWSRSFMEALRAAKEAEAEAEAAGGGIDDAGGSDGSVYLPTGPRAVVSAGLYSYTMCVASTCCLLG